MENIQTLRKRLRYQSQYRGTREMDLLLNKFAPMIDLLSFEELKQFEILLSFPDYTLYGVFFEKEPISPAMSERLVEKIRVFVESL